MVIMVVENEIRRKRISTKIKIKYFSNKIKYLLELKL